MITGEEKAWGLLSKLAPNEVCRRSGVEFDPGINSYLVPSYGHQFIVSFSGRKICGSSPKSELLLKKIRFFFNLSVLVYLTSAKDIPLSGRLIKPESLKGGQLFFRGSHILPLEKLAGEYRTDPDGFLRKGAAFGGEELNYGDASFKIMPFPRMPIVLILWKADDEFPARADLLLDSTCELQLPLDIIWSIAMMSVIAIM